MSTGLDAAVALYRGQDYAGALVAFAELARTQPDPGRAAVLHANAGTAAAHAGQWGEAVWHLGRARVLAPRDETAAANLARVRESQGLSEGEAARFTTLLREAPLRLTPAENSAACGAALGLALLLLAARRLPRARLAAGAALLLAVLAGGWWLAARGAWERAAARAVVIPATAIGHAEPDERSEVLFRLEAGALVDAERELRGWRLVESQGGARGWVRADEARPLR